MWQTRPVERNGVGLSVAQTNVLVREIQSNYIFLSDTEAVCLEWQRLVVAHEVKGAKVHDARLVATMRVYGIQRLLTLNEADFRRYPEIVAVSPQTVLRQA